MTDTTRTIEPQCEETYVDPNTGHTVHCVVKDNHETATRDDAEYWIHRDARSMEWTTPKLK